MYLCLNAHNVTSRAINLYLKIGLSWSHLLAVRQRLEPKIFCFKAVLIITEVVVGGGGCETLQVS